MANQKIWETFRNRHVFNYNILVVDILQSRGILKGTVFILKTTCQISSHQNLIKLNWIHFFDHARSEKTSTKRPQINHPIKHFRKNYQKAPP